MCEKPNNPAGDMPIASSAILWLGFVLSQHEKSVCSQNQHVPQEMVKGHDDAVALFEVGHAAADFLDDAHGLVAHDVAVFHGGLEAVVEVQVAAADGGGGDADDGIRRVPRSWDRGQ